MSPTHPAVAAAITWASEANSFDGLDPFDYREGYIALVRMFADHVRTNDYYSVLAGANAVYGWMTTILKKGVARPLWEARRGALELLRSASDWPTARTVVESNRDVLHLVNGSVVGTSKFLHFLNPGVFPIWDSNIRLCFAGTAFPRSDADAFPLYVDAVWDALNVSPALPRPYVEFVGQDALPVRRLELLLFLYGQHLRSTEGALRPNTPLRESSAPKA